MLTAHNALHDVYGREQGMQSEAARSITRHDTRDLDLERRDICYKQQAEMGVSGGTWRGIYLRAEHT
jgi:hypothetical protein